MSVAADVVSTVKLLAAPSAEMADAAVLLTGLAVPAVPVNTSTLPASAAAGATPIAAVASSAPANASGLRNLRRDSDDGSAVPLQDPIPLLLRRVNATAPTRRSARRCNDLSPLACPMLLR